MLSMFTILYDLIWFNPNYVHLSCISCIVNSGIKFVLSAIQEKTTFEKHDSIS